MTTSPNSQLCLELQKNPGRGAFFWGATLDRIAPSATSPFSETPVNPTSTVEISQRSEKEGVSSAEGNIGPFGPGSKTTEEANTP